MPEYKRGVAVAYCDSSGPLEEKPQTFYAISPTPKDWPKARAESFYKEYNQSMLADLSVHEAMPGHYLQAMHNNKFPSKLRAVFGSGPFVEGWAVYGEWLMAQSGFGGPRVKLQQQKMLLRVSANAILDHDIHAGTMEEALEKLSESNGDVLLSDIGLPDGDGWELIGKAHLPESVYAIAMSGFGMGNDRTRSRAAGYRHHLLKPFTPDLLDEYLDEAIHERSQRGHPHAA